MEQSRLVERILALTLAIEHSAALADWPEAARLTDERSPLFAQLTREQDAVSMVSIDRVRAIDAAISADAATTQTELRAEYLAAMSKVQVAQKYHSAARF